MAEHALKSVDTESHVDLARSRLISIFSEILGVPQSAISTESSPDTIDSWNSLNHMRLITAIEEQFDIQFTMDEIENIQSFTSVLSLLISRF